MAKKKKKKSLIDRAFGDSEDASEEMEGADLEETEAEESEETSEQGLATQSEVANLLEKAEVKASADVKPAKESIQKGKTPKAFKVRGKDMKFMKQNSKGNKDD